MAAACASSGGRRPGMGAESFWFGARASWRTLRATALLCVVALMLQLGLVLAAADSSTLAMHAGGPLKATTPTHIVASEAWTATQAQEWTAWRAAQMDANKTAQPRKPTYTYTCYKDDNVIIYTSSQDTCACSAQNVDAYARLRRAATNYAGLRRTGTTDKKTGVESSACLVDFVCDDTNKKHAVIRGCAIHDKKADVVLRTKIPQSSSNPVLPIAIDFFTYDTQRRQAELFGAPGSSPQLRAKCVYKASSSSDPNLEYGIWQVTLTSQTIAFNEIIAGALGTTMATFSSRLGTQLVSNTQAIKSFGAKLSVRRSIVAAAIGYAKDEAEDVYVTAQVDASGRLNAYDERRVFGPDTAVTRLRAGAASTERFYAVDDDVCGGGNSQTPDVSAYVMASNFTAKGTTKLVCSGSTKPPWNLNTAQVDMKMDALTMPLSLFESGCLSKSSVATLERVKLKYERVMETPSIEASYGASHGIVHVAGKLQGRAPYVNFEAILKLGGGGSAGASFIQPSLDSNGNAPLRKLLRISDGTFVQTILSALPIRSDSVADESLSFVVTGNTNVNLQGTMTRNEGGSFKSSVVFDEGSCELVSTMSGEWVTPGGIKAIFDITKPCRPDSSSSDVSLTFANPLVWAPSLSQTWSAKTSVGCSGDASVKQLAVTADAPQESIDVSIAAPEAAGQLTIKGAKMFASLASGRSTEIHALSSWASQQSADGEVSGSFETTFAHHTDAASAPAAYLVSPDHNGDSQNAIEFVKNAFHLVGVSADMENAFNGTGPVVGIYDMLSSARLSSRASNACMLDSKTELRSKPSVSVTCLGQLSSSSQPKGLNAEQVKRLQAARAHVVADFVHTEAGIKAAPSRRMIGIAASRKSASIVLEPIDRELAALVEHELSLESSAVVMVAKRGTYRNLLPSADELRDELHENGPVVGAKTRFAQRLDGTATKLYRAGLYFIARVDRSKGMWKKFHDQNAGLALYTALFGRSGNHTRPSVMELDGAFDGTRKRLQLDTPLRGDLEWPETGIVLRADGGSVSELITTDGKPHQYLLNGRFNVELPRTYPIKLHSISRDTPNAVVWRAKGSLQITADDATGKLSAGGLLTFRTITLGSDPISLSLSRYVRFWQGTVGMSTNFEKPYVKCLGYAIKASWGKAERNEAESREDFYKHEVKLHFHVAKNKEAARVVDAISIEAHFNVIDGFQMMLPFEDIANVPSYVDANARLLNATKIYDAVVTINEDPAAINTGRISDGCLRPPKRKSSISFSSMDLGNAIWLRSFDRSNIVLEMDLSKSGPGMLSGSPSQSIGNAVVATGKFLMNIAYIGAFRLGSQNEIHRVHHKTGRLFKEGGKSDPAAFDDPSKVGTQDLASQLKTQNVQAEIILRTEMRNTDAVDLDIDASVAALGVSWMAKIHHVSAVNGILDMKDGLGLDVPKDFETHTYGFMMDLKFHPGEDAVVNAKVLTSSHDVHSQDMKSFFAMKLENEGATKGSASALKAYSSYIDVEVTKYHKRVASQIEEGLSSDAMASQQSLCRSHPLNFGACIVAALNVASPGSVSASRRALLATSNAGEMVSALAKAAKVLKSKTSAAASLAKIQITAAKPTPINPYVSLTIKLNDAKSLLTHCLAVADPSSCTARQDEVDRLTNETYAMANTAWLEGAYDSGFEGLVTAEVKGSVAGGVKKAFNVEVNDVYPATFAKAIFTAYLDDVHASVAELIATEIQGSYRTAKQASEETCTDPVFVDTNYPLKACSKFPPPASVADARGAWGGWGDAAGLLDLARAMQREGMHANGFKEPLTSFADSETIAHDSFSVSTVVASVALDSSEISEEQRKVAAQISTDLSTRAGEATEGTMNASMSMHGLNDDGVVVVGGKLANSKVQLQAYVSSDFTLGMLPAVVSALASPLAMANRTFVDADGGYFLAEPWGVSARREPGMVVDTSPAHLADTARYAISVASRDILNKSLADCGPVEVSAEEDATTRRRALLSAGGGSSASAAWRLSGLAWTGLFGICALALHRTAGNAAHGGAAAYYRRMYGLAILMMLALSANFVTARAQSASDVIQWAGSAIDLGVELAQEGITDQEISFTVPELAVGGLSTSEIALTGTITWTPGSNSDFSDATYDITASAGEVFTVAYDGLFNLEVSDLSVTISKASDAAKGSWSFTGTIGGISLELNANADGFESMSLNGEMEEDGEEGMTNLLAKFSDMLGDSLSISSVQLDVSDEDGNGKYDIGVSFECSIWSSEATLAGTWDEGAFASFETTVSMGDAKIELSGAPFCTGGDDVQGKLTYTTDDETETQITASVAAECGANNKPTSLTIQGSTDGTVTIPMGSLALEIQSLEIKYVNSLGDDESSGSFSLAATVDPVTLKAKIASQDSSYQLTIGDSESSEPVDWAASVRSIGDSDNQLQSAIPPALTGDSMQLYYLDVTVKTSSEETTYALALKFELAGATVEGSIETDGSFSPTQASLSVKTETIRLTFGYESSGAEDDGGSTYDATFALLQELGGESARVSAFDLEGSVTIDEGGNFDVSVSQGDDPITISVLGTDFVITGLSCTYASSRSQLTLKANVEDTFSIDVAATLPIKSESSRRHLNQGDQGGSLQSVAFTTESVQFSDLASLGAMGSLVGKGIADIEGEITDLELSYDASTGDVEVSATITIMSFEADISATYGSSDNILKTFSVDMSLGDSIQLTAEGTSPCGEDGSGGTISGKIKMDDLPYGLGNLDLDCSATFTCKSGANGNRVIQSVAVVAEVNEGLDLTFDAFNVGLNTLRVEYDSADGQFSFTGGFGTDGATQVELRFNYSPGGAQSASDINLELEVKEDISFESLHNKLLGEDGARAATQSLSDDASGIGADVKASSIKPGSIIQLGMVNGVIKFAIVGLLRIYDMDVRLVIVGEDLTNADTRRFLVAVDIAARAGALPEAIRTIAEQSGGLQMSVMIANKEGTFTYPRTNLDEPNGDGARRLLADVEEEPDDPDVDDNDEEVIEMDDKFVLKITPGEANDPFRDLKADQVQPSEEAGSSSSPFNSDDFGSALYVTIGSISPLDFSVFVSINIEKQFGGDSACATETTLKNIRVGFRYQNNAPSLFLASNWKISMPECENDAPVDGTEPTVLRLAGEIGISLPFTITGALSLDAGDDGWNNPFDLTESLTIYQVSVQFGFTPPTLSQFGISAQADLGEMSGDVALYVQIVPTPQALFRSELENVDTAQLFAMMMGSSDGASFFADGDPSFIEAAKFTAYANTGAPRTLGDSGEEIPTGFGVATEDARLLWGLVTADELSFTVGKASQGVGGSVEVFANIDPILLFGGILQITGRGTISRPSLLDTIWDRRGGNNGEYGVMASAYGQGLWVVFEAKYDYPVTRTFIVRKDKYFVDDMPDGSQSALAWMIDQIQTGTISDTMAYGEDSWFVFGSKPEGVSGSRSSNDVMVRTSLQQLENDVSVVMEYGNSFSGTDGLKKAMANVVYGDGRWVLWWDEINPSVERGEYGYFSDENDWDQFQDFLVRVSRRRMKEEVPSTGRSLQEIFVKPELSCGTCYGSDALACCNSCAAVKTAWQFKNWALPDDLEASFDQCNCGKHSCYGAASPGICCRTCDDVRDVYRLKKWRFDESTASRTFTQCIDCGIYTCGGAGEEGECCRTCDDVRQKYKAKGWGLDEAQIPQCQVRNRCGALTYGDGFWFAQTHIDRNDRPPYIYTVKASAHELAVWLEDNANDGYLADQIAYGKGKWVACMYKQMDDDPKRRSDVKVHVTDSLTSTTSYSNPIMYVDVQASTNPRVIVCADGRLYFLGIEVLLTFYLTVNTGDANCRTILEEKGVELNEPTNNNVQIPEGGGVYFDGQISWGELKVNVAFSANTYRIWESDAQIQFYLAVDAGDSSIITIIARQLTESLGTMLQRFVDDIINFGAAFVESLRQKLRDAEAEVTRVENEINVAIAGAQQKLDDASAWANRQWSYHQQYRNDCDFWSPGACAKAGFYATAGAAANAAVVVAREFLNQARNAVSALADTARGALSLAQDALELANRALDMLRNALNEGISSTMNALSGAADALDAIIAVNNLSIEACIGEACESTARLSITLDLFRMGGATHELEIDELSITAFASSMMSAFGDSILSFVKSFIPEEIRSALNLDRRRRSRRWQRRLLQTYENVDCLNATQVRECFPDCCTDDSKSWATLEDSLLAVEALSPGGSLTERLNRGSALSPEERKSIALDIFLSTRGTYVNTNGKAPIFSAAARKPKPRYGDIILAYEPGEVNDFAGNDIPTLLTPVLKSATYGLDSEGTAKVDLACKKCGGLPSNGLWRVHVSGVVYQDMPAVISALGSRKMQLQLRYEMLGRGYLSPTLVELTAGSAEAMLGRFDDENMPMVKALADRPAISEVAAFSEYTVEAVCRVDNRSASGGSNIVTAITKKSGGNGLSDGAMAGIALAMLIVGMVTVACIVVVIYKKKKAAKTRQKIGTYAEPGAAASHGVQMSSFKFEENTVDADTPMVEEATIAAASSSPLKRQVSMRDDPSFRRTGSSRGDIVTVAARRWLTVLGDTRVTGTVVDDALPGANHVKVYFPGDGEHEGQLETVDVNDARSDISMLLKSC